ncbi:MAG TPA: ABC-F family ATP-binding cassette domain-containing protein [Leptospiraceae bacterium]|nr:ABC-F family ATP-binding cassette domain-containing protein [Leptospiraceae bacterium]
MLQFINIRHQYGPNVLFDGFSWHIKNSCKIALIGPNGAGKTTLFQFAAGTLHPDSGEVVRSKNTAISLFHQIPVFEQNVSVIENVLSSIKHYKIYLNEKHRIDKRFETTDPDSKEFEKLLSDQSHLEEKAHTEGLHDLENNAKKILSGLGFSNAAVERPIKDFSPGFQHRAGLAICLLNPHSLLLLDEPTNHLDDSSKEWLASYLQEIKTTFVLVTHDPDFLNRTTDTIAEISSKGVFEFKGTLEEFLEEKNEVHEKMQLQFKKEEDYIKKRMEWIDRFRAKATKAKQAQSALKRLEKRDKVDRPEDIFWNKKPDYKFNYSSSGKIAFRLEDCSYSYSSSDRKIFEHASMEVSAGEKIALVGPNGAGKSTLMKCIAGLFQISSGNLYFGPKTERGYFSQTHHDELDGNLNLLQTVQKKYPDLSDVACRTALGHFSFSGDSVYKSVSLLSGGEQSRLRMALLVLQPCSLLLMDEPTNHLDMVTRDALKRSLADFPGAVVIISHDPDFLKLLCTRTFELSGGKLKDLNCSFEDYMQYHKEGVYEQEKLFVKEKTAANYQERNQERNRQKKIQKDLEKLESDLNELEKQKKSLEVKMADPGFYQTKDYKTELELYETLKLQIDEITEKWALLSEEVTAVS